MTTNLFIILFVILSGISTLVTEAVKKAFPSIAANLLALIDALIVGGVCTVGAYIFLAIPFTLANVAAIIAMIGCIWLGSMTSFDKVKQLLAQISGV